MAIFNSYVKLPEGKFPIGFPWFPQALPALAFGAAHGAEPLLRGGHGAGDGPATWRKHGEFQRFTLW